MSTDLPSNLERLKEEGEEPNYDPPYEAGEGFKEIRQQHEPKPVGEEIDLTETQEARETGLPDVKDLEHAISLDVPPIDGDEVSGFTDRGTGSEMGHGELHGYEDK